MIIEIKTADNFGLLYRIVQCLNKNEINISSARLSTSADQAVDAFYMTDAGGGKIVDKRDVGHSRIIFFKYFEPP